MNDSLRYQDTNKIRIWSKPFAFWWWSFWYCCLIEFSVVKWSPNSMCTSLYEWMYWWHQWWMPVQLVQILLVYKHQALSSNDDKHAKMINAHFSFVIWKIAYRSNRIFLTKNIHMNNGLETCHRAYYPTPQAGIRNWMFSRWMHSARAKMETMHTCTSDEYFIFDQ